MKKIMFNDKYGLTKAVLEGRKTQTRRMIPQSWLAGAESFREDYFNATLDRLDGKELLVQYFLIEGKRKPHYAQKEILAVAQSYETIFKPLFETPAKDLQPIKIKGLENLIKDARSTKVNAIFEAQDRTEIVRDRGPRTEIVVMKTESNYFSRNTDDEKDPGWNNKMFVEAKMMPYRIRITNIRLERLQDISNEDCLKEGILEDCPGVQYSFPTESGYCGQYPYETSKAAYAALIDKICGKGTWQKNPWVFVYDFELIK